MLSIAGVTSFGNILITVNSHFVDFGGMMYAALIITFTLKAHKMYSYSNKPATQNEIQETRV